MCYSWVYTFLRKAGPMKRGITLFFLALLPFLPAAASSQERIWDIKEHCDVASNTLKILKTTTQEQCQQACGDEKSCAGFVYISGWKRCQLKTEMHPKRQVSLRFISGELDEQRKLASS